LEVDVSKSLLFPPRLGVNIDHIATIRQARGTRYPDPVEAAFIAERAGAAQITVHLREDRRHIQDRDVEVLAQTVKTRLNLEMGATDEMAKIALKTRPQMITLVPEKREERTTEGGLDVASRLEFMTRYIAELRDSGAQISLFIDPEINQVEASLSAGADIVELHTGDYCADVQDFKTVGEFEAHTANEFDRILRASEHAHSLGLQVAAGHGLHYLNVIPLAAIPEIEEYNIGHAIVARAAIVGFEIAVREMIESLHVGFASRIIE